MISLFKHDQNLSKLCLSLTVQIGGYLGGHLIRFSKYLLTCDVYLMQMSIQNVLHLQHETIDAHYMCWTSIYW